MDEQHQEQPIQDAEIITEESTIIRDDTAQSATSSATQTASSGQVELLLNLENLIKRHISSIEKLQDELKKHKEMVDGNFEGSEAFRAHSENVKKATKERNGVREQIVKQPGVMMLIDKVKNMKQEMKEMRMALSDYLNEYQRISGLTEIQDENGEFREIINTAKAIKRGSAKK